MGGPWRLATRPAVIVVGVVVLLSAATVWAQYLGLPANNAFRPYRELFEVDLVVRHDAVIHSTVGDPWRFRLLSEWEADGFLRLAREMGFSRPATVGFLAFRFVQNALIFLLAWVFYRRLGVRPMAALLGLGLVAWGMTQALLNAGLAVDTYGDLILYLGAAILILTGRWPWIVPLAVLAALNRETGGCIPLMLIAVGVATGIRTDAGRRAALLGLASLAAFAVTYGAVRLAVGPGQYIRASGGRLPGWAIFRYNVFRGLTWDKLFETMNIVPILALVAIRRWPRELVAFGAAIVPLWFAIHVFTGVLAETRLVLVPYAVVFVPGALAAVSARGAVPAVRPGSAPR